MPIILNHNNALFLYKLFCTNYFKLLILILFIQLNLFQFPQILAQEQTRAKPVKLHHADIMDVNQSGGQTIRKLIGNVKLEQGDVILMCSEATEIINQNIVHLSGNVIINQSGMVLKSNKIDYDGNRGLAISDGNIEIIDGTSVLTANRGRYSTKTMIAEFFVNVKADDDSATIFADNLTYDRNTKNSYASGNVTVKGKNTNTILIGQDVVYIPNDGYMLATGKPVLFQIDTLEQNDSIIITRDTTGFRKMFSNDTILSANKKKSNEQTYFPIINLEKKYKFDTLSVIADSMEAFRKYGKEKYIFIRNVELVKSKIAAKADSAVFDMNEEYIKLYGVPIIWFDETQLFADSTVVFLRRKKLDLIFATGNTIAVTKADSTDSTRINQISGADLKIIFADDSIRTIKSWGNAKSLYFVVSDSSSDGAARNSADSIYIIFDGGAPDKIKWLGGIQGEFIPENLVVGKTKELYLPNFRWSENKPKRKFLKLNIF
ncbi:MAG: hypothetical protein HW421_2268 [Ignavibacteria bacterium]|nr:hypothetical protein [Ignavibacteria bacterium]